MSVYDRNRRMLRQSRGTARCWLVSLFAFGAVLAGSGPARAFEKDTHYALTYYLAIQLGYTWDEAREIASADLAVDQRPKTDPVQLNPFNLGDFHAFVTSSDPTKAAAEIAARKDQLWQQAVKLKNPGILLHFVQDEFSHKGFTAGENGHAKFGNLPDYLSWRPEQTKAMVQATIECLTRFMTEVLKQKPSELDPKQIDRVIARLIKANPTALTDTWFLGLRIFKIPDYGAAKAVIDEELGFSIPEPKVRIGFDDNAPKSTDWRAAPDFSVIPARNGTTPRTPSPAQFNPFGLPQRGTTVPTAIAPTFRGQSTMPTAPTVPFPTSMNPVGTAMNPLGNAGIPPATGQTIPTVRIGFDDGVPKTVAAPKGVAMRIGIDRGTLRRVETPAKLTAAILADK